MENQLVIFNLADENYGVNIADVDGIVKMQPITTVPHAPNFVEGITNLRGEVLPVIDLRKRFGLPQGDTSKDTRIINVEVDGAKVGMVVDAVSEVLRVSEGDIEPPSPIVTTIHSTFITGIAKVGSAQGADVAQGVDNGAGDSGRLIILLDLAKVLSIKEQANLQAMQHTQAHDQNEAQPDSL